MISNRKAIVMFAAALVLSAGTLCAQTQIAVLSTFTLGQAMLKGLSYSVGVSIAYPSGLSAGSYVSATQLNTDFQGFVAAYPNLQDPPEAILSSVLASILQKYPQIAGAGLTGTNFNSGLVTPGPLPAQLNTIEVFQGTVPSLGITAGILANRHVAPKPPADR